MRILLLSFLFFGFLHVHADPFFEEEPSSNCHSLSWEAGIEYLLLKPCANDLAYVAKKKSNGFKLHSIDPSWSSGLRASLSFPEIAFSSDFQVRYTLLNFKENSHRHSENSLIPLISSIPPLDSPFLADTAKAHWKGDYQLVELLANYPILINEYFSIKTQFGVDILNLKQHLDSRLTAGSDHQKLSWKSSYFGSGLSFGLMGAYRLSQNFEFLLKGNYALLVGKAKAKQDQEGVLSKDRHYSHFVNGYTIESALCYDTSLFNFDTLLKLGYEFCTWTNLPTQHTILPSHDISLVNTTTGKTWGFHGLSFGIVMKF